MTKITYKDVGVDIQAGEEAVRSIRKKVRSTFNGQVLTDLGTFGALFQPNLEGYREPVLVASVDGVGTKLKVAFMTGMHHTIGEDLVNHSVNDILTYGAKPLFFMDYWATQKLNQRVMGQIVEGLVRGCRQNGFALIGGETAEMPDLYQKGEYDLAGTIVGLVERERIINGQDIVKGDVLIGLASNGLHTNGYTLARRVLFEKAGLSTDSYIEDLGLTLGEELLRVHHSYLTPVLEVLKKYRIKGIAHVTGGGIVGNTTRILPERLSLRINWGSWPVPPIFHLIQKLGNIDDKEMRRVFNLGVGYIIVVDPTESDSVFQAFKEMGEKAFMIGKIGE